MLPCANLTPTLRRGSNLSISSPRTPLDFLSPTASLRRNRLAPLASQGSALAENDDETEKRNRQLSRATALALQSPNSRTPRSARPFNSDEGSVSGKTGLTNTQLKELYSNCLKLSTENKINAKNAFGLHLIDYMQEFLTNLDKDQGVTNFQIASCTLDAGAKIYAGRVDSIHAQAYKMLGGLGRAENGNEGEEHGHDGTLLQNEVGETRKKKRANKSAQTIETNLNNINVDQFDLEFEVDPLFQKTSASFDEGGTRGLLLNHLSRQDDFCETLLDSNTVTASTVENFQWESFEMVEIPEMKDTLTKILPPSVQICPHFAEFCFSNWDRNDESGREDKTRGGEVNEHAFNMDAPAMFENTMNNLPDDGGADFNDDDNHAEEVDDDLAGLSTGTLEFADGEEAQIVLSGEQRLGGLAAGSATDLGSLVLALSSQPSEYSYFKHDALEMWAGPQHWKTRSQFKTVKGLSERGSRKNETKKDPFRIDYNTTHDFKTFFCRGKAATILSKKTLEKHSSVPKTLPDDLHYAYDSLMKLFLKSKLLVCRQHGTASALPDDGNSNGWYNYENANDCVNFCPDAQENDGDESLSGGENGGFNEESSQEMSEDPCTFNNNETVFHGGNFVAQPNRVQKIDIAYSKTAKKIDVKKVKQGMWDILISSSQHEDANKENVPEISQLEVCKEKNALPLAFTELYQRIPQKISKQMAKNLSVPIAFVCLLHLANEKSLKIVGKTSMDDFCIAQES